MRKQHRIGKPRLGNCWITALAIIISGRASKILIRRGCDIRPHILIVTKKGNIAHFSFTGDRKDYILVCRGSLHIFTADLLRQQRYISINI